MSKFQKFGVGFAASALLIIAGGAVTTVAAAGEICFSESTKVFTVVVDLYASELGKFCGEEYVPTLCSGHC